MTLVRRAFRTFVVAAAVIGVFAALGRRRARSDDGSGSNSAVRAGSFDSWPAVPRAPEHGSIAG